MPKRARCPHCDKLFNRDVLDAHIQRCSSRGKGGPSEDRHRNLDVIVDGNNVAYHLALSGKPRVANLILARQSLINAGYKPIIVISAALVHKIDRPDTLRELIGFGQVIETSRGKNDDLTIIKTAQKANADIVSNDRFLDWQDRFPWVSDRLRKYRMTPSGLILV